MALSQAKIGYGATFKWGDYYIAEITKIAGVNPTLAKLDSTTFGSPYYHKEILPGMINPGDVPIEGWARPDDTNGQLALLADMNARTSRTFVITMPLVAATWTGTGYITSWHLGDITPENLIPIKFTLSLTGKPVLGVTDSTDPTGLVVTGNDTGALTKTPVFAGTVREYICDGSTNDSVTVTVTAAAALTITVNGNAVTSGNPSSAIAIAADTITTITVVITDTGKSPITITILVSGGA